MIIRHSCANTRGARKLVAKWAQNGTDNKAAIVPDQRRINGIPFSVALSEWPPVPLPARLPASCVGLDSLNSCRDPCRTLALRCSTATRRQARGVPTRGRHCNSGQLLSWRRLFWACVAVIYICVWLGNSCPATCSDRNCILDYKADKKGLDGWECILVHSSREQLYWPETGTSLLLLFFLAANWLTDYCCCCFYLSSVSLLSLYWKKII